MQVDAERKVMGEFTIFKENIIILTCLHFVNYIHALCLTLSNPGLVSVFTFPITTHHLMSPVELSTRGTVEQTVWYSVTQWDFPDFSSPIILLSRFIICKADFLEPNIRLDFQAVLYHSLYLWSVDIS